MKSILFILFGLVSLFACKQGDRRNEKEITGEYKRSTSAVTFVHRNEKIEVSICFADENCIEPCYTGILSPAGGKKFSGWVHPENEDSVSNKTLVVLTFSKSEVDVLFPQRSMIMLGSSCDPEGSYKKK